ncbi:MAG: RloB family protein [Planctomycetota bacterium]|nr:RloB family protein [Planctomycetota bacterium]
MRKKRPIQRIENRTRDASLVVIASEDRFAVKQYFELFQSTRIQFHVLETDHGESSPQHVMARLEEYLDVYSVGEGDQFWLVCDTDHWIESNHIQNLVEVVKRCKQKDIAVALSNPCFDLWLLLHFDDFPAATPLTSSQIGDLIRGKVANFNKTKVYDLPFSESGVRDAIERSRNNFVESDIIPGKPQTAIHLIIEELVEKEIIGMRATHAKSSHPASKLLG